jgi:hypothetical protein
MGDATELRPPLPARRRPARRSPRSDEPATNSDDSRPRLTWGAGEQLDPELGAFIADVPPPGARKARLRGDYAETTVYTYKKRGGDANVARKERKVRWRSPPVFYVHRYQASGFTLVSGADYDTYAALRRAPHEYSEQQLTTAGTETAVMLDRNSEAVVKIPTWLLDIEP